MELDWQKFVQSASKEFSFFASWVLKSKRTGRKGLCLCSSIYIHIKIYLHRDEVAALVVSCGMYVSSHRCSTQFRILETLHLEAKWPFAMRAMPTWPQKFTSISLIFNINHTSVLVNFLEGPLKVGILMDLWVISVLWESDFMGVFSFSILRWTFRKTTQPEPAPRHLQAPRVLVPPGYQVSKHQAANSG